MTKIGDRIELEYTSDPFTSLRPGDRGRVTGTADISGISAWPETQVHIKWDNGSTLSLLVPEDRFKVVDE